MRKKRVLLLTDYAGAYTGFGKQCKLLLSYLFKTDKYELLNAAQGTPKNGPHTNKYPWKTVGTLPDDPSKINQINQDPNLARMASYGVMEMMDLVKNFKPDVIFAINDTWGSQFVIDMPFYNKIPTVCWNTFDSLPLLPDTVAKAKNIKHYWTWSDFARKEFDKLGFNHVKNQYPLVNTKNFYKLSEDKIAQLKAQHNLPQNAFIIGFVFRNQLRKLINTQIEAYGIFKRANPEIKNTFLYTHTHYGEGWDIPRLCQQYGVDPKEVLCTYICKQTRQYFIAPFHGQDIENPITKQKTLVTANVGFGVTDEQLNEIYNLMSLYSHPATSGACELPCVEAALTEKIITTSAYSFGDDIIEHNKGSIGIKYTFYTEHGTQFLKSQPSAYDLSNIFKKVYEMSPQKRGKMEKDSRNWALNNYSIDINGKKIEEFIDTMPILEEDAFNFENIHNKKNANAIIPHIEDNKEWLKRLYKDILAMDVSEEDDGLRYWMEQLSNKAPRDQVQNYFRQVAQKEQSENNKIELKDLFKDFPGFKKVLLIQPQSIGDVFLVTSLFESLRDRYPSDKYKIYIATNSEYRGIIEGNPFIDKWIPYHQAMDSAILMEGGMNQEKICDIVYHPYFSTQRLLSYTHNGEDKIDLELQ
jgi:hypothetical protein